MARAKRITNRHPITLRLHPDLLSKIADHAEKHGRTKTKTIEIAIKAFLALK